MNAWQTLSLYLQLPYVRYAIIVGVLVALSASLLGVSLVLKRFSFIGDGLSHVSFGTLAIATVLNLTERMWLVMPLTVLAAVLLLHGNRNRRINGAAAIAMLSVTSLAVGYHLLNVFSVNANVAGDVCQSLFGGTSFITLSALDVWLCVGFTALLLILYILFYRRIFAVTFDESFALATGLRTELYHLAIASAAAVVIVLAMRLVGSLIVSALIIFPPLCAMRMFGSFRRVVLSSALIAVAAALLGILAALLLETPPGPTIVAVNALFFLFFSLFGRLFRRRRV